jgi:ElaB/YqjD/DUF883 family membrane-anchored ribosome-binding protein
MTTNSIATDLVAATAEEVVEAARDQYISLLAAIRRHPLQSAGIAAGVGLALALLLRGKQPRRF